MPAARRRNDQDRFSGGFSGEHALLIDGGDGGMIQTLCSKRYLNRAPEGMDQNTWLRLKESYEELRELIDEKIPMIAH